MAKARLHKRGAVLSTLSDALPNHVLGVLLAAALDRPDIAAMLNEQADERHDWTPYEKAELAAAAWQLAQRKRQCRASLDRLVAEASALQRQHLLSQEPQRWLAILQDNAGQPRNLAKYVMALAAIDDPAAAPLLTSTLELLANLAGPCEPVEKAATPQAAAPATDADQQLMQTRIFDLEAERARLIAELGQAAKASKNLLLAQSEQERQKHHFRETKLRDEKLQLQKQLRNLEKQSIFVRQREDDKLRLQRLSAERDQLVSELALLRTQLLVASVERQLQRNGVRENVVDRDGGRSLATGIFVDGANLAAHARLLFGGKLDFEALYAKLAPKQGSRLAVAYIVEDEGPGFAAFIRRVRSVGFETVSTRKKRFADGTVKADQDVAIAVDVLTRRPSYTRLVLASGDGDFVPLVRALQKRSIPVVVAAFTSRAAPELIQAADEVVELGLECVVSKRGS